jgi:putative hydrolase of the HAD superfamily
MSSIKAVLFDFGGVLIDIKRERCIEAFSQIGFPAVEQYIGNYTQSDFFLLFEKGLISPEEFYAEVRSASGKDITNQQIDEAWNAFLIGIPEYKLDLLLSLRKKYRVLMLSNTNEIHFKQGGRREFEKQGLHLSDYFDKCYLSYELKMAKPQPEIFQYILDNETVKANEILFLDDGEKNIEVAKSLGFQTYLAQEAEDFRHLFE